MRILMVDYLYITSRSCCRRRSLVIVVCSKGPGIETCHTQSHPWCSHGGLMHGIRNRKILHSSHMLGRSPAPGPSSSHPKDRTHPTALIHSLRYQIEGSIVDPLDSQIRSELCPEASCFSRAIHILKRELGERRDE